MCLKVMEGNGDLLATIAKDSAEGGHLDKERLGADGREATLAEEHADAVPQGIEVSLFVGGPLGDVLLFPQALLPFL